VFAFDVAAWGYDQVFDFSRAEGDRFDMRGSGATSFAQLSIGTIGADSLVQFGGSRFDVYGVTGLVAGDFIFA
jgi:urease beta subunit